MVRNAPGRSAKADWPARALAAREIVMVCRRLYERGLIAGQDGNVTVRIGPDRVLVTPAGFSKVDVRLRDLVELTLAGTRRGGASGVRPSSEVAVHLAAYRARPDVRAVVHAHPPLATAFAVAGEAIDDAALAELQYGIGRVPVVPFAPPGSLELAQRVATFLVSHDVVLLANHGAVAVGPSLLAAHQRMESLEHAARILLAAQHVRQHVKRSDSR